MQNDYGGVIWTDHALARLKERNIKQGDAWATFKRPDESRKGDKKGVFVYYKTWGNTRVEVVATQSERKEWIILSVWSKQVRIPISKRKERDSIVKSLLKFLSNN